MDHKLKSRRQVRFLLTVTYARDVIGLILSDDIRVIGVSIFTATRVMRKER